MEQELMEAIKGLKTAQDEVKGLGEEWKGRFARNDKAFEELEGKLDKALTDMNGKSAELEQLLARRGGGDAEAKRTLGQAVTESEEYKSFTSGKLRIEVKDITSAGASAGALIEPQTQAGIIAPPDRRLTVRDLLTPGTTDTNLIEYYRETGFTNNADAVAEGALKPESDITFDKQSASVTTIAHWVRVTNQALADAAQLRSHIDGRLRYGLAYKEELQLLAGDGNGENLEGLLTVATAYADPSAGAITNPSRIDKLRLAMLQAALAEYPTTGIVMHPVDWMLIETQKDGDGRYLVGDPQAVAQPTLWGVPVVATQAMAVGEFLTGAFRLGAQVFDRMAADVLISTEDRDNFVTNRATILAEERLALAIYRPEAFVTGAFANPPTA